MARMIYEGQRSEIWLPGVHKMRVTVGTPFNVPDDMVKPLLLNEGMRVLEDAASVQEKAPAAEKQKAKPQDKPKGKEE